MQLTLPMPPSVNRIWRRKKGGGVYLDPKAAEFKETVGRICLIERVKPIPRPIVTLHVYFPNHRSDVDNRAKLTLDALQGFAYQNDKEIVCVCLWKHFDKNDPRVEVTITTAPEEN